MAGETAPRHYRSTGFHDIKPVPDFPAPPPVSPLFGALLLALIAGTLILRRYLAWKRAQGSTRSIPALGQFEGELAALDAELRGKSIGQREFGGRLSLSLRSYLETQLSSPDAPFPAVDCTVPEVLQRLPAILRRAGQHAGRDLGAPGEIAQIVAPVGKILQRAEKLTFADERSLGGGLTEQLSPEQLIEEAHKVAQAVENLVRPSEPEPDEKPQQRDK